MRDIRIINDSGVGRKTKIIDIKTGEEVQHVKSIEIAPITVGDIITAKLEYIFPSIDLIAHEVDKVFDLSTKSKLDKILIAPFYIKLVYGILKSRDKVIDVTCIFDKYRKYEKGNTKLEAFKKAVKLYFNLFRF